MTHVTTSRQFKYVKLATQKKLEWSRDFVCSSSVKYNLQNQIEKAIAWNFIYTK